MITSVNFKIPHSMCDRFGNLSLRNLVGLMVETSIIQAQEAEKNIDTKNLRRILYCRDIKIKETIKAEEEIKITTMPLEMDKFYCHRNFYVEKDGKILVKAYARFFILDINRLRPIKASDEFKKAYSKEKAIYRPEKITYRDDFTNEKRIFVRNSDIDTNFHVNNAVYFDYILDYLDIYSKDISYINMVYKNEIRDKKSILAESVFYDNQIDFRLKSKDSKRIYTYGKIIKNV